MPQRSIIAIVLIIAGVLALGYQGFTYTTRERAVDIGPLKVDVNRTHTVPIAPIVGVAALVGGIALLVMSKKSTG